MPVRLLMADGENRGIQAYRWFVAIGVGAVIYLAGDTRQTMKDLATEVTALKVQVSTLDGSLRGINEKNTQQDARMDRQDVKIDEMIRELYRGFRSHREPTP